MRDPGATRRRLLSAAAAEIHRSGFQAASLDRILAAAGVTKGALYHHFPNKTALGLVVVNEVFRKSMLDQWIRPLDHAVDPLDAITQLLSRAANSATPETIALGCPLNNMAQEISLVDEGLRQSVHASFDLWREGLASALRRGQSAGVVRRDIDADPVATFLVSAIEGSIGIAKNAKSVETFRQSLARLIDYVEALRSRSETAEAQSP